MYSMNIRILFIYINYFIIMVYFEIDPQLHTSPPWSFGTTEKAEVVNDIEGFSLAKKMNKKLIFICWFWNGCVDEYLDQHLPDAKDDVNVRMAEHVWYI